MGCMPVITKHRTSPAAPLDEAPRRASDALPLLWLLKDSP